MKNTVEKETPTKILERKLIRHPSDYLDVHPNENKYKEPYVT